MSHPNKPPLTLEERVAIRPKTERIDFDVEAQIIGELDGVLFLNKPAGWPTSGRSLEDPDCLQHRLMSHAGRMIWAIHQLDGDTSGLNVFTRRRGRVPHWQKRLHFPQARKEYLAIVHGQVRGPLKIDDPIGRRQDGTWGVSEDGKSALTLATPVISTEAYSLLRVHQRTGRTHQIRVHLSHHGHPLVGEFWYNDAPCTLAERHMLHAWRTRFDRQEEPGCVLAAVPEDFREVAAKLGVPVPSMEDGHPTDRSAVLLHVPKSEPA